MIPVATNVKQIDNLPGEEIEFEIGDPRHIMRINAKQYSDTTTATIREYSTNGLDANIEAGVSEPLLVTLPSVLAPYFKVQDCGAGMSRDILRNVYTRFGISTKRESNDYNGTLGIGSKAALAYTETFTVISVHEGIKTSAVVMRRPDWSIVMKIIATEKTTQPSGTEIIVPVHNIEEFTQKAYDFYKFWKPGQVLINGREPEHAVGKRVVENLYYSANGSSYVVMGNVPYRIHSSHFLFQDTAFRPFNFVAYVDNGDVEFTPSREDLEYTDHTKNTLRNIFKSLGERMVEAAEADVANAESHLDAFRRKAMWKNIAGYNTTLDLKYKCQDIPNHVSQKCVRWSVNESRYSTRPEIVIPVGNEYSAIVVGHTGQVSSRHKAIAKNYFRLNNMNIRWVYFLSDDTFDSDWIDYPVVSWDDMKKAMPRQPRKTNTTSGQFTYWDVYGRLQEGELPEVDSLYYVTADENRYYNISLIVKTLGLEDAAVVKVAINRIDKFVRDTGAKRLFEYARSQVVTDLAELYTDADTQYASLKNPARLSRFDETKIDDPVLKSNIVCAKTYKHSDKTERNNTLASALNMSAKLEHPKIDSYYNVDKEYPLLSQLGYYYSIDDHVYWYMNAWYKSRKDNND